MKQKKKIVFSILLVVAIITAAIGGGVVYYFSRKIELNIYDYVTLSEKGFSDDGRVYILSDREKIRADFADEKEQARVMDAISFLKFDIDKSTGLANDDVIQVTIDQTNEENKKTLTKYRIKPTEETKAYTIANLTVVPTSWHDVKNQTDAIALINEQIEQQKAVLTTVHQARVLTQTGKDITPIITEHLQSIYYKRETDKCDPTIQRERNFLVCGTVAFVYKYEVDISASGYYYTGDSSMYFAHAVTNIYEGGLEAQNYFKKDDFYLEQDISALNLHEVEEALTNDGYQRM